MNDAYERRTLLQQLGSILEMLVHVKEHEYELQTVGELVRRYKRLTEVPLLCHVAQTMTLRELEHRTLRAFAVGQSFCLKRSSIRSRSLPR